MALCLDILEKEGGGNSHTSPYAVSLRQLHTRLYERFSAYLAQRKTVWSPTGADIKALQKEWMAAINETSQRLHQQRVPVGKLKDFGRVLLRLVGCLLSIGYYAYHRQSKEQAQALKTGATRVGLFASMKKSRIQDTMDELNAVITRSKPR